MSTAKEALEVSAPYTSLHALASLTSNSLETYAAITSPITPTSSEEQISTYLETLWNSLLLVASQTEWSSLTHIKLSNFLQFLQTGPSPSFLEPEKQELPQYNGEEFTWSKLPDLNIYIRSWYNSSPPFSSPPLNGLSFSSNEWVNLNAFLANLTRASLQEPNEAIDYSLYAIWSLRALEVPSDALASLDPADLKAAAVWIITARAELHNLCKSNRSYDGNLAVPGEGFKDRDWRGYTLDRWNVWQSAFEESLRLEDEKEDGDLKLTRMVRQATMAMRMLSAQ
ncbi:hypothetical protein TWF481_001731 [Arthrobotrys musiformis]|uniref:Uncharacterized protein n=1 Tax=Arthrobotrys musiformis TaxID=47236 RepID=A0AAV9VVP1_9PEZI